MFDVGEAVSASGASEMGVAAVPPPVSRPCDGVGRKGSPLDGAMISLVVRLYSHRVLGRLGTMVDCTTDAVVPMEPGLCCKDTVMKKTGLH